MASESSEHRATNRAATVVALMLALFMAAMEMTVVSTAMPTVVGELGGAMHYAWVFSVYMLTSTITVPIYGKLADLYGRKPVMLVAMALFLVGSMASGQARTMNQLIAFRAVQGIGAGGMQPVTLTIVGDIFKIEERGRMQGIFGAVWAVAGLAGPLVGGLIVAALSWRWVFYVNVPFGLLSAAILWFTFHERVERRDHRLDFGGAALLSAAVIALLLGTDGVAPFVLLPLSILATAAFLVVERKVSEPIVPLKLFAERTLLTSSIVYVLSGGAMVGLVTFVPLYAQGAMGVSPTQAGATIAPMAVAWPIASAVAGRTMTRFGFRALVRVGMALVAVSAVVGAIAMSRGASLTTIRVVAAAFGIGMGISNTSLVIAVQTSVGFSQRGVATASTMFFRNIGGTVGVGVMGVVLAKTVLAGAAAQRAGGAELLAKILGPERRNVDPAAVVAMSGDLIVGLTRVSWVIAALAVGAAFAALFFPVVHRDPHAHPR